MKNLRDTTSESASPSGLPRLQALQRLRELLALFHVANDADDHWSGAEATDIRNRAVRDIRQLLDQFPFLAALFPTLGQELEMVHQRDVSWSLWTSLEETIRKAEAEADSQSDPPDRLDP